MRRITAIALSTLAVSQLVSTAGAAIISVSGQTTLLGVNPPSATFGTLTGPNLYCWNEKTNITTTGVWADMTNNPANESSAIPGVVAGTYDSHFLHLDNPNGFFGTSGSVTFSSQIVAVFFRAVNLDNTDALFGNNTTTYDTFYPLRGLNAASLFGISGNTLKFNLTALAPTAEMIELRVLTHSVPAPGSAATLGLAGLFAARRKRR
ncbi:MAG: hypothetical protein K2Y21_06090 [Phycisphaerales bacterium]|nr:hypothetical protein [Phycisphaerales bacterium]